MHLLHFSVKKLVLWSPPMIHMLLYLHLYRKSSNEKLRKKTTDSPQFSGISMSGIFFFLNRPTTLSSQSPHIFALYIIPRCCLCVRREQERKYAISSFLPWNQRQSKQTLTARLVSLLPSSLSQDSPSGPHYYRGKWRVDIRLETLL